MSLPAQYFRAGAASVVVNTEGHVLALERADIPGAWQLPQGGLESAEEPLDAAFREVFEETGIPRDSLEWLDSYPEPLVYELPVSARSEKTGRGQVQYWHLFRFRGSEGLITVKAGGEFREWKWMRLKDLIVLAAEFRKPVYQRVAEQFQRYVR